MFLNLIGAMRFGIVSVLMLSFSTLSSFAQNEPEHRVHLTLIGGSTVLGGHVFGFSNDRKYSFAEAQASVPLAHPGPGTLRYRFDFIPVSYLREPRLIAFDSHALSSDHRYIYGIGANPLALEYDLDKRRGLVPYAEFTGGFLHFSENVFSPIATQFNFSVGLGGGVRLRLSQNHPITFGYRYFHISNANLGARNPGGDFQLLYAGYTLR